ncbi:alpha-beta hydrolase superfamily lysophospholipase [Streptomyces aurantiacus]|uniref:alpha/beta hydrolase n=1 Tax=Streptomyces aurantiacus TaxID=47760 RepID=UPI00278D0BAD|nr:alpha/beta hydrolase [Streptomyces aurantiacus]MDQ0772234.1 alpha-beta hydrolase superfamily lysophospholipase [Streptomyces aurantiacus]
MTEYTDHHAPAGLRTRGTVIVVPGRGETRETYTRLGSRLAADAYRVRVIDAPDFDAADLADQLDVLGVELAAAGEGTAGEDGVARPVVLLGADTGALAVAALLGADTGALAVAALLGRADAPAGGRPDAVVLAGLPGHATTAAGTWDDELDVRTSCPTHRGRLTDDTHVRRGSLNEAVPDALLSAAHDSEADVPALILVGDADPLADHDALVRTAKSLPRARLSVVRGAHHDVLNDLQHRSVAAEIVTFLETLRNDLVPLIAVETSTW